MSASSTPAEPVFTVALRLRGRPVLVIGGGEGARERAEAFLALGARVSVVWPNASPEVRALALRGQLLWYARAPEAGDFAGMQVAVLTERDPELARWLSTEHRRYGCLFCAVDQPLASDYFHTANVQAGPLQLAVSTGGAAPLLARRVKAMLARGFGSELGEFAHKFAQLRTELRASGASDVQAQLEAALDGFAIDVRVRYPGEKGDAPSGPSDRGDQG